MSITDDPNFDWEAAQIAPPPHDKYIEGNDAFRAGKLEADNPYANGSDDNDWWNLGWCDAEGLDSFWKSGGYLDL